jgi:EAL domain-containing protein (putative c-di-GMP-specific phosphodiesterase class I)
MLTGSGDEAAVFEAARAGAAGYMEKTGAPAEIVRIVRSVSGGAVELPAVLLDRLPQLDQLAVHYQPIVDLASGGVMGFEALVRWVHPDRGMVFPGEFIGLAEHTSFIVDIDQHVRDVACLQAAAWNQRFPTTPRRFVSVNVSGRELRLADLAARIERTISLSSLEPSDLMIEVTETFLVEDLETGARRLREISDLGVLIALDDFGTGYSSLDHLRRLPIDIIKLDKSFTDDLPDGARALKLVESVGRLADDMGALTEAEGIETAEQAECLLSLGWKLGQGYHFFRPLSATAIEAVL